MLGREKFDNQNVISNSDRFEQNISYIYLHEISYIEVYSKYFYSILIVS